MFVNPAKDPGVGRKVLHEGGRDLGKVSGAPRPGHVLVLGSPEHRVHGVAHLVEEVVEGGGGEEGWCSPARRRQVEHEDHHGVLVGSVVLLPAATDSEMAILIRFTGSREEVAVDVTEQFVVVEDRQFEDLGGPELAVLGPLNRQPHPVQALEQVVQPLHGHPEGKVLGHLLDVELEPVGLGLRIKVRDVPDRQGLARGVGLPLHPQHCRVILK